MSLQVPNVVITNPKARKIARTTLDSIGVLLGVLILVLPAVPGGTDVLVPIATVALSVYTFLRMAFGLSIDNPNTPKVGKYGDYSEDAE